MTAGLTGLSSDPPFTDIPRSASPQHFNFDEKHGTTDEGVYGNFYGHDADPMADVFEIDKVPSVDPELGRHRASILVRDFTSLQSNFPYAVFLL